MTTARAPLAIYHEHPDWFRPLFAELDRRGIAYQRIDAREPFFYDPTETQPPFPVLFNRMSPSAYLRGGGSAIFHTLNFVSHLERLGTRVVNGSAAFTCEISKALQLTILAKLRLPAPRSRVIHRSSDAPAAAEGLRFPIVVKANIGGSGAGIVRYDSAEDLQAAADADYIEMGLDDVALVQEYIPARDGHITRVETLGGKYQGRRGPLPHGGQRVPRRCPAPGSARRSGHTAGRRDCRLRTHRTGRGHRRGRN